MSGDLISRKASIKAIHDFVEQHRNDDEVQWTGYDWLIKEDSVVDIIKNLPTAYDVDNVVERLEEKREKHRKGAHVQMYKHKNEDWAQYLDGMQCGIRDSIEIVKSGGIK